MWETVTAEQRNGRMFNALIESQNHLPEPYHACKYILNKKKEVCGRLGNFFSIIYNEISEVGLSCVEFSTGIFSTFISVHCLIFAF